jgi:hypothetical protein
LINDPLNLAMKFLFAPLVVILLLTQPASAQSTNATGGETIQLRTLSMEKITVSDIYYQKQNSYEKLPIAYFRPSPSMPVTIDEDRTLTFFERAENPEGGYLYTIQSQTKVPADSRQIILFATTVDEQIYFKAVSDNLSSDARDWLYINTTDTPIAVQLGEANKPVGLAPGQSTSHRAEVEAGSGAAIRVAVYKEDGWKRIYSRFWPIYEGQRSMVVFVEEAGKIKVYNFFEAVGSR